VKYETKKERTGHVVCIILLFLIVLFVYRGWFGPGIIAKGDFRAWSSAGMLDYFGEPVAWRSHEYGGYDVIYAAHLPKYPIKFMHGFLVNYFGFDFSVIGRLIYLLPFLLCSTLGMYFLVWTLFKDTKMAFCASLFYTVNPAVQVIAQVSHGIGQLPSYGLAPVVLFFLVKGIKSRKLFSKNMLYAAIILSISMFYDLRIAYLTAMIIALISLSLFIKEILLHEKKLYIVSKYIIKFFIFGIIVFFLNFFWLYYNFTNTSSLLSMSGFTPFDIVKTSNMLEALTLTQKVLPLNFFSVVIPLLAFGFLIFEKINEKNILIFFISVFALISVFLSKSIFPPFENIFFWLFETIPGFIAFRAPNKFLLTESFFFAILIGYFISSSLRFTMKSGNTYFKKYLPVVILTVFILFIISLWIVNYNQLVTSAQWGGSNSFKPTKLSEEHSNILSFFENDSEEFRVFYLPTDPSYGGASEKVKALYSPDLDPGWTYGRYFVNWRFGPKNTFFQEFSNQLGEILSIYNIRYVYILPSDDPWWDVYCCNYDLLDDFKPMLDNQIDIVPVEEFRPKVYDIMNLSGWLTNNEGTLTIIDNSTPFKQPSLKTGNSEYIEKKVSINLTNRNMEFWMKESWAEKIEILLEDVNKNYAKYSLTSSFSWKYHSINFENFEQINGGEFDFDNIKLIKFKNLYKQYKLYLGQIYITENKDRGLVYRNTITSKPLYITDKNILVVGGRDFLIPLVTTGVHLNNTGVFFISNIKNKLFNLSRGLDYTVFYDSKNEDDLIISTLDKKHYIDFSEYTSPLTPENINESKFHTILQWDKIRPLRNGDLKEGRDVIWGVNTSIEIPFLLEKDGKYEVWIRGGFNPRHEKYNITINSLIDDSHEESYTFDSSIYNSFKWIHISTWELPEGKHKIKITTNNKYCFLDSMVIIHQEDLLKQKEKIKNFLSGKKILYVYEPETDFYGKKITSKAWGREANFKIIHLSSPTMLSSPLTISTDGTYRMAIRGSSFEDDISIIFKIENEEVEIEEKIDGFNQDRLVWQESRPFNLPKGKYNIILETDHNRPFDLDTIIIYNSKNEDLEKFLSISNKNYVNITKINSVKYLVNISAVKPSFLMFTDNYNPNWHIKLSNDYHSNSVESYSAINSFFIDENGIFNGTVYYQPQEHLSLGFYISLLFLFLLLSSIIIRKFFVLN